MMTLVTLLGAILSVAGLRLPVQNLKGEARFFPADLPQTRAIVILTFTKSASNQATEWTRRLRENEQTLVAGIYQIAIMEDVPSLLRSFVISGIKRGIPKNLHDRFWIVTSSAKEWRERLGAVALDEPHVLVVEDRSRITWTFHGGFSESTLRSLLAACSGQKN